MLTASLSGLLQVFFGAEDADEPVRESSKIGTVEVLEVASGNLSPIKCDFSFTKTPRSC